MCVFVQSEVVATLKSMPCISSGHQYVVLLLLLLLLLLPLLLFPARVVQKRSQAENQIKRQRCPTRCVKLVCHRLKGQKGQSRRRCCCCSCCPCLDGHTHTAHPVVRWWQPSALLCLVPYLGMFKCQLVYSVATLLSAHCSWRR